MLQVIKILEKELNLEIKYNLEKKRFRPKKSEVFKLLGCNKKANKVINWKPKYSGVKGFTKALLETYNWYKLPKNLEHFKDKYNI